MTSEKTELLKQKEVLTRRETAEYLSVCLTTLDKMNIPHVTIGRTVRYSKTDLEAWLSKMTKSKEVRAWTT